MNPRINRQRGKQTEKKLAKLLSMQRVGILGKHDLQGGIYIVEVKHRQKFVGENFLKQAEGNCEFPKIPIAIVHIHGQEHDNDIVLIRIKNYRKVVNTLSILSKGVENGNDQ